MPPRPLRFSNIRRAQVVPGAVLVAGLALWVTAPHAAPLNAPAPPAIAIPRVLWTGGPPPQATAFDYTEFPRDTLGVAARRVQRSRIVLPGVESADVVQDGRTYWTAQTCCASVHEVARRVTITHEPLQDAGPLAQMLGVHPSLARLDSGRWLMAVNAMSPDGQRRIHMHTAARVGEGAWVEGPWLAPPPGTAGDAHAAPARLVPDGKGAWLLPVCYGAGPTTIAVHRTRDGETWEACALIPSADEIDPAIAVAPDGAWVVVTQAHGRFLRRVSEDRGRGWSAPDTLAFRTVDAASSPGYGFALRTGGSPARLWLAFPGAAPDTTMTLPALQPLYLAASADAGRTWTRPVPALVRPGRVAIQPVLAFDSGRVAVLAIETAAGDSAGVPPERSGRPVFLEWDAKKLFAPQTWPAPGAKFRYALNAGAVHGALRLLTAHVLARPPAQRRLFVEAYWARGLAAASPLLARDVEFSSWQDPQQPLAHALAFADRMVLLQDASGYWPLGYGAIFAADLGAAVGTFAALEPYADSARVRTWEGAAVRFCRALEDDHLILPSGAFGVGWPNSYVRFGPRADRSPYLVSTALAGIEVHAWLWKRTSDPKYRDRVLRAFDYTLSQIQPDGSLPVHKSGEGALTAAAYVEEGWMMLDVLWQDPAVLARLQQVLPVHVQWILQSQHPDGTWDGGADGEFARTPAIVNFLVWYDQRCKSDPAVRVAIQRAGRALSDSAAWPVTGLFRAGNHHDVQRAHSLRALAAIAGGRAVP